MEDSVEKILLKTNITRVINAIEATGCVIVNPNYNPVKGMENGLILRSADKDWLLATVIEVLKHQED